MSQPSLKVAISRKWQLRARPLRGSPFDSLGWVSEFWGGCKATWKREFKLPRREAGPPNHLDDEVDSDHEVVNQGLSL